DLDQAALGWLHGNCGHCHNADRPASDGARCYDPRNDLDFRLRVGSLGSVHDTPTWNTAVGTALKPGDPDHSEAIRLASTRKGWIWMPPIGSEKVDDADLATLREWVDQL